jgi:hypothetical protein
MKSLQERIDELDRRRAYELDDPDGTLRRSNDAEEIEILREKNRILEEHYSKKKD